MFITSKENDFLQQNIYRQSWNSARKRWFSQRQMWQFRQRNGMTDGELTLHHCVTGMQWVNETPWASAGDSEEASAQVTAIQVWTPTGCLPARMSWRILCRTRAVTLGASATTSTTVLRALVMAPLESISYTPGLFAGRTSEELLGAQGSGQTAWFHTSRGSILKRVLWTCSGKAESQVRHGTFLWFCTSFPKVFISV